MNIDKIPTKLINFMEGIPKVNSFLEHITYAQNYAGIISSSLSLFIFIN